MQKKTQSELLKQLKELIAQNKHQEILQLTAQMLARFPNDLDVIKSQAVALIKLERDALSSVERLKGQDQTSRFLSNYILYLNGKPLQITESQGNAGGLLTLVQAQAYFLNNQYGKSFQFFYLFIQKQTGFNRKNITAKNQALITESLVSCLAAVAVTNVRQGAKLQNILRLIKSFEKPLYEWILNLAVIFGPSQDLSMVQSQMLLQDKILSSYLHLVKKQQEKGLSKQELAAFVDAFKQGIKQLANNSPSKIMYQNAAIVHRLMAAHETAESLKKIEQMCKNDSKLTIPQSVTLHLNRLALSLQKNREDSVKIAEFILRRFPNQYLKRESLALSLSHTQIKGRLKEPVDLKAFVKDQTLGLLLRANESLNETLEVSLNPSPIQLSLRKYLYLKLSVQESPSQDFLFKYLNSLQGQDPAFLTTVYPLINKLSDKDLFVQVYQRVFSPLGNSGIFALNQAKLFFQNRNYEKSRQLMRGQEFAGCGERVNLMQMQRIALKEEQQQKLAQQPVKVKRKKVRKIRYPKNFDPKNPGPLPNPERWLPKWERKEFRKRANLRGGKTQGATNTGKEQMNLFGAKGQTRNKGKNRKG